MQFSRLSPLKLLRKRDALFSKFNIFPVITTSIVFLLAKFKFEIVLLRKPMHSFSAWKLMMDARKVGTVVTYRDKLFYIT